VLRTIREAASHLGVICVLCWKCFGTGESWENLKTGGVYTGASGSYSVFELEPSPFSFLFQSKAFHYAEFAVEGGPQPAISEIGRKRKPTSQLVLIREHLNLRRSFPDFERNQPDCQLAETCRQTSRALSFHSGHSQSKHSLLQRS